MAITYTWSVDKVKIATEGTFTNSVIQTHWTLSGTDESGNTGTFKGSTPFTAIGSTGTFIPYSQLQESDVVGWIQSVVNSNPQYSSHINDRIAQQLGEITSSVTEVHAQDLPWASTGTVVTAADVNPGPV